MNGRIYDPLLGRFLSADVMIQAPFSLQSYNRYSYVFNNPLSLTDPTGWLSAGGGVVITAPLVVHGAGGYAAGTPEVGTYQEAKLQQTLQTNREKTISMSGLTQKEYEEYETLRTLLDPPKKPDAEVNPTPELRPAPSREGLDRLRERQRQGIILPRLDLAAVDAKPIETVNSQQQGQANSTPQEQTKKDDSKEAASVAVSKKLVYKPTDKHDWGHGTPMDLDNAAAQTALDGSVEVGKQRYAFVDGQLYEFKTEDHGKSWHGYRIPGNEAPPKALKDLRDRGDIDEGEFNKLRKGKL